MAVSWPDHFPSRLMGRRLGSSGLSSFAIALEAWRRGLEVTFTAADLHLYTVSNSEKNVKFNFSRPDSHTTREDYLRLDRKAETNAILASHGIPSPTSKLLEVTNITHDQLRVIASEIGYPLVLKPNQGSMGRGVFSGIKDSEELFDAFQELTVKQKQKSILIERHHTGDDYRLLVVGNRVVGAVKRIPANVIGDGKSTVAELISAKNDRRIRNPFLESGLIKIDYEVRKCLTDQGLTVESIPPNKRKVTLRRVANASAGGDVQDVTDTIPENIKEAAISAVRVLPNIYIAGVDVLYDASDEENYVIIEINSRPQIGVNMYPSIGTGRDAPKAILDSFFPDSSRPSEDGFKTIRFNPSAVRDIFAEGLASKVTLPHLPLEAFPFRQRFLFEAIEGAVQLRPYTGRIVKKMARTRGISGKIISRDDGSLELFVAGRSASDAKTLVDKVSEFCGQIPKASAWEGIVTVGFQIS
ncbi:hypothetical protein [Glutamicibacter sp. BW77]|uniref:hypothetical protein n=1 Tax=Glutamicibacter sp. BW77 TaxID=2024402 RepID=UPI000BB72E59|nr:hypothetical protein [Glutamicibacter sp. BW77]PCC35827.1 hypothetical protein CIK74_07965 [Glutamicibacter sp. BW77]